MHPCVGVDSDATGRLVGFVDLWVAREPEPFGNSLNVECIDYFPGYHAKGLETVLLEEAATVARSAGLPALDIGTNTSSGDYPALRRFGLKLFYEYDEVACRCRPADTASGVDHQMVTLDAAVWMGLVKVDHWCPTNFSFRDDAERIWIAQITDGGHRAILELWHDEDPDATAGSSVAEPVPNRSALYAQPEVLDSPTLMSRLLGASAALAGEAGAERINLPCPSSIELESAHVNVIGRTFAFAWMRKELT